MFMAVSFLFESITGTFKRLPFILTVSAFFLFLVPVTAKPQVCACNEDDLHELPACLPTASLCKINVDIDCTFLCCGPNPV